MRRLTWSLSCIARPDTDLVWPDRKIALSAYHAIGYFDFDNRSIAGRSRHSVQAEREEAMQLPRRRFLHLAAGAAALPVVSRVAIAQTYPARPITMIVPFPAGGPADLIGRVVAEGMKSMLGQPIIIENV